MGYRFYIMHAHIESRLGGRIHDNKLCPRECHRFYEAVYESWHQHPIQGNKNKIGNHIS